MSEESAPHSEGRRKILKLLAAGGAGVAATALVPGSWTRPLATIGVLPAHAQVSETSGDLRAEMAWYNSSTWPHYELHVIDPAGDEDVFGGDFRSATLEHSGNAPSGNGGSEIVGNRTPGVIAAGTYQIYLRSMSASNCGLAGELLDVILTADGSTTNINLAPSYQGRGPEAPLSLRVADVTFPGGVVTNRAGQPFP